jgi:hypothetical protein
METERLAICQPGSIPIRSRPGSNAYPRMPDWGLDLKKNLLPPLREKFVLDIPFHRTAKKASGSYQPPSLSDFLSPVRGEGEQKFDRFVNFVAAW